MSKHEKVKKDIAQIKEERRIENEQSIAELKQLLVEIEKTKNKWDTKDLKNKGRYLTNHYNVLLKRMEERGRGPRTKGWKEYKIEVKKFLSQIQ